MKKYELNYILSSATTDEAKENAISSINAFIEKNGGKIETVEKVGNKRLAYEIKKQKEGFYVLTYFDADSDLILKLNQFLNITENVLRQIIIIK